MYEGAGPRADLQSVWQNSLHLSNAEEKMTSANFCGYFPYAEFFPRIPPPLLNPTMTPRVGNIMILTLHFRTKKLNNLSKGTQRASDQDRIQIVSSSVRCLHSLLVSLLHHISEQIGVLGGASGSFKRQCKFDQNGVNSQPAQKKHRRNTLCTR